jgi:hypothetical protein
LESADSDDREIDKEIDKEKEKEKVVKATQYSNMLGN